MSLFYLLIYFTKSWSAAISVFTVSSIFTFSVLLPVINCGTTLPPQNGRNSNIALKIVGEVAAGHNPSLSSPCIASILIIYTGFASYPEPSWAQKPEQHTWVKAQGFYHHVPIQFQQSKALRFFAFPHFISHLQQVRLPTFNPSSIKTHKPTNSPQFALPFLFWGITPVPQFSAANLLYSWWNQMFIKMSSMSCRWLR